MRVCFRMGLSLGTTEKIPVKPIEIKFKTKRQSFWKLNIDQSVFMGKELEISNGRREHAKMNDIVFHPASLSSKKEHLFP